MSYKNRLREYERLVGLGREVPEVFREEFAPKEEVKEVPKKESVKNGK